jgi:hypothetical protein
MSLCEAEGSIPGVGKRAEAREDGVMKHEEVEANERVSWRPWIHLGIEEQLSSETTRTPLRDDEDSYVGRTMLN